MSRIVTDTLVVNLSSYDETEHQWYSVSGMSNAYTDINGTSTYATINQTRGANAETWFYFKFDTSSIPNGSTINSTTFKCRQYMSSNTTNVPTRYVVAASGTTEKGTRYTSISNNSTLRTLSAGTWTLAELRDARLKYYAQRGTGNVNTNYPFRVYCGELTVGYTYTLYAITTSSSVSGVTISSQDAEVIGTYGTTITISGTLPADATVLDNGTDVTSSLSGSGTTHTYSLSNVSADHIIVVSVPSSGPTVFLKQNGTWVLADAVYYKQNGSWVKADSLYVKENGTWKN